MEPDPPTTHTVARRPGRRWGLFPRAGRFPKRWVDWFPLSLAIVVVLLAAMFPVLDKYIACREGLLPTSNLWSQDQECVGVTAGSYAFGQVPFEQVMRRIAIQNDNAVSCLTESDQPKAGDRTVTIGVMTTMTSPNAENRARYELEGMAAAQAEANQSDCIHPIRLKVAQMGRDEQGAEESARLLADDPGVVAVVGMGLSNLQSAKAIRILADRKVPMVADVITAEGFDQNGSEYDDPDYSTCKGREMYASGVAMSHFYRVAFRNALQIAQLIAYLGTLPEARNVVVVSDNTEDPYPCTALPLIERDLYEDVERVTFSPEDQATVTASVSRQICISDSSLHVVYAARSRDLGRFLRDIGNLYRDNACKPESITVASLSDGARMRAEELKPTLEKTRTDALMSEAFRDGRLQLIYTPLADPDIPKNLERLRNLQGRFRESGFEESDLDSGWAINAYDALTTVVEAVKPIPTTERVTRSVVNTNIDSFNPNLPVTGAVGGHISFDNYGNRVGYPHSLPDIVRLCPLANKSDRTRTVFAVPGTC